MIKLKELKSGDIFVVPNGQGMARAVKLHDTEEPGVALVAMLGTGYVIEDLQEVQPIAPLAMFSSYMSVQGTTEISSVMPGTACNTGKSVTFPQCVIVTSCRLLNGVAVLPVASVIVMTVETTVMPEKNVSEYDFYDNIQIPRMCPNCNFATLPLAVSHSKDKLIGSCSHCGMMVACGFPTSEKSAEKA